MLHDRELDRLIFGSQSWEADRLTVISGYVGPNPIQRCADLPFKVTVVYGMLVDSGVSPADHEFFRRISSSGGNTEVRYCTSAEVHSKLYLWSLDKRPTSGLVGSANFTWPGLNSPGREILIDVPADDLDDAGAYARLVLERSTSCLDSAVDAFVTDGPELSIPGRIVQTEPTAAVGALSLLNSQTGSVPDRSGINWGFASANVNPDDAYLPISVGLIRKKPGLIPPRQAGANTPVELLWDDGVVMVGYLEGTQPIDHRPFPKQLASHPEKNILGKYLRKRLGVPLGTKVTMDDLKRYGRTSVGIALLGPGRYFLDFRPT